MENLKYDIKSANSIINYAKQLYNKTLREACESEILNHNYQGKGNFGQILEKFYFGYEPNSISEADFPEAGLELKTSPLKILKNGQKQSKERLVLNIIDYMSIHQEDFEKSTFWKKNKHLLLIFYLYFKDKDILDLEISLIDDWEFPNEDLEIIKSDWLFIKQKVLEGKAHELSEGDTYYLGACTKGSKAAKSFRKQPNNEQQAKQRAFSLKQGYLNYIIMQLAERNKHQSTILQEEFAKYGKTHIKPFKIKQNPIEKLVQSKFEDNIGKSTTELLEKYDLNIQVSDLKQSYALIVNAILEVSSIDELEQFKKAEIEVKTIRVKSTNVIEQSISFPSFKFEKIYNEDWINSEFKERIEKKFLFIFFKQIGDEYILEKYKFWNMPFKDRNECRKVWLETKKVIQTGKINREIKTEKNGKTKRLNNFPKMKDNDVAHVRPHGQNTFDTYPLPVVEFTTKEKVYTKQSFWLNHDYVVKEIYLKNN